MLIWRTPTYLSLCLFSVLLSCSTVSVSDLQIEDVGDACDPTSASCDYFCLQLSRGGGVCTGECDLTDLGDNCPADMKCNRIYDGRMLRGFVCLPNLSCGELMVKDARCDQKQLRYCENDGIVEVSCDPSVGTISDYCTKYLNEYRYDCSTSQPVFDQDQGCRGEPLTGRCDGNTIVYCQSQESGRVEQYDCGPNSQCVQEADRAKCADINNVDPCGAIPPEGRCEGTTVARCDPSRQQISYQDCALQGQECEQVATGARCITTELEGDVVVQGSVQYEKRIPTSSGLGSSQLQPVVGAMVQLISEQNDRILATTVTNANGEYILQTDQENEQAYVAILTMTSGDPFDFSVRNCPLEDCGGQGDVYAALSDTIRLSGQNNVGQIRVTEDSGIAGAFNIFELTRVAGQFAQDNLGRPPALTLQWKAGSNTSCQTSCFSPFNNTIYILGPPEDTDEFDDSVLGHELGHFLESAFSRSDSPGGAHDGTPTDPRLAWGEGYGTFTGSMLTNSSFYIDTGAAGASAYDISEFQVRGNPNGDLRQDVSEYLVATVLWHISQNGGSDRVFSVLGDYFRSPQFADRGVVGVDFVDFLDGWLCQNNSRELVQNWAIDQGNFPYNFSGPENCQ